MLGRGSRVGSLCGLLPLPPTVAAHLVDEGFHVGLVRGGRVVQPLFEFGILT